MNTNSPLMPSKSKKSKGPSIVTGGIIVGIFVLVFVLEQIIPASSMLFTVLKKGAAYALVAVSMNLLNGFTGLFSLGQAGFMLIGAYTFCIFTIPTESRAAVYQYYDGGLVQFSIPVVLALVLAGLAAALFAWLIGLPVLRLKSDYLAIATLGFAEIIRAIFQWGQLGPITNGSNVLRMFPSFNSMNIKNPDGSVAIYLSTIIAFLIAGVCIALIVLLVNSTYGRAFKAIRDDEVSAQAMGINLARHKMLSFVISSFFAGVGGAMLAMYMNTVQAKNFTAAMTYELLLIVVLGGIGSITGSIMGAFLYVACSEWWLRFLDNQMFLTPATKAQFVFAAILMVVAASALVFTRNRDLPEKKRNRIYLFTGIADLLLLGWLLWFQFAGGFQMPLLRNGFRTVVFAVVIMAIVLFFSRGIMGTKELPDLFRQTPSKFTVISIAAIAAVGILSYLLLASKILTFALVIALLCLSSILKLRQASGLVKVSSAKGGEGSE